MAIWWRITPNSPEGMEEILWSRYTPSKELQSDPLLDKRFLDFYRDHVRKLLWLRSGQRYVSKNNYHVARIELLVESFQDAQFVIPIRHPSTHVESLVRQHKQFCEFARKDRRVSTMLSAAGHFEFGPQRSARGIHGAAKAQIEHCWANDDEYVGYALLWAEVYGRVLQLLKKPDLSSRLFVVKYEEFCEQPLKHWQQLARQLQLSDSIPDFAHIQPPGPTRLTAEQRDRIWSVTGPVAEQFGFDRTIG